MWGNRIIRWFVNDDVGVSIRAGPLASTLLLANQNLSPHAQLFFRHREQVGNLWGVQQSRNLDF